MTAIRRSLPGAAVSAGSFARADVNADGAVDAGELDAAGIDLAAGSVNAQ